MTVTIHGQAGWNGDGKINVIDRSVEVIANGDRDIIVESGGERLTRQRYREVRYALTLDRPDGHCKQGCKQ